MIRRKSEMDEENVIYLPKCP